MVLAFVSQDLPGRGRGLVATRTLTAGETFHTELPVVATQDPIGLCVSPAVI